MANFKEGTALEEEVALVVKRLQEDPSFWRLKEVVGVALRAFGPREKRTPRRNLHRCCSPFTVSIFWRGRYARRLSSEMTRLTSGGLSPSSWRHLGSTLA